jgi:uroporphyrinogen-III synthase
MLTRIHSVEKAKEAGVPDETPIATSTAVRERNFNGARIALLEARHSATMANLVTLYGGEPYAVPALREAAVASPRIDQLVDGVARGRFSTVIFLTGVAAQRLFEEADRRQLLADVQERLRRSITVVRGPKPGAVLARYGVKASVTVDAPYTTRELLAKLASIDIDRKYVALLHYGERHTELSLALRTRGARLADFLLYEWQLPNDTAPLQKLVRDLIAGNVDAIAFTNKIQVRHLNMVAAEMGLVEELAQALVRGVVVASIGPSCTHQLLLLGIRPLVVPPIPKMRPLISALSDYFGYVRAS